jgi:hypothetical protein
MSGDCGGFLEIAGAGGGARRPGDAVRRGNQGWAWFWDWVWRL